MFGLICTAIGGGITAVLGFQRLFADTPLASRPLLMLGILFMVVGVQFLTMGLLGEMMVRTYHESQGKPPYIIRDILEGNQEKKVTTIPQVTISATTQMQ
jgi:hypothetical protein